MHEELAITFAIVLIIACAGIYRINKDRKQALLKEIENDYLTNNEGSK